MAVYKTRNDVKNRSIHSPYLKNETFCNKAVAEPDLQISKGGGGAHPDLEIKGGSLKKNSFSVLRASFWSKNEGGPGPPGRSPRSATVKRHEEFYEYAHPRFKNLLH